MSPNYCLTCGLDVTGEPHPMIVGPDGQIRAYYPMHIHEEIVGGDMNTPTEEESLRVPSALDSLFDDYYDGGTDVTIPVEELDRFRELLETAKQEAYRQGQIDELRELQKPDGVANFIERIGMRLEALTTKADTKEGER